MGRGAHSRQRRRNSPRVEVAALLLAIAAVGLVVLKVTQQIAIGVEWDTYAFLCNAADLAGRGVGYIEPHRPPLMSFLASLVFRMGLMEVSVIQWVDGLLTLVGVGAFYRLLRRRFEQWPAAIGSLALLAVPPIWESLGIGYTDFPSIGMSALALLMFVKATDDDPRWYLAAFPVLVAALLTRLGTLIFFFPVALWLLLRAHPFRHARWILQGMVAGVVVYIPAGLLFLRDMGDILAPLSNIVQSATSEPSPVSQTADASYSFLSNLHLLVAPESLMLITVAVLACAALGLLSEIPRLLQAVPALHRRFLGSAVGVAPAIVAQILPAGSLVRQVTILLALFVVWKMFAPREPDDAHVTSRAALGAVMLAWFLAFLDAHGHLPIKIERYFITMAPGVIYYTLLGWASWISLTLSERRRTSRQREEAGDQPLAKPQFASRALLGFQWGLFAVFVIAGVAANVSQFDREPKPLDIGTRETAAWLAETEGDISELTVYSDAWPHTSWYMRSEAYPMSPYDDPRAYDHELRKRDVDYMVDIYGRQYDDFETVFSGQGVTLLARAREASESLPRILFVGDGWENYLEYLTDYEIDLMFSPGRHRWLRPTVFADGLSLDELQQYPVVAAYGFSWHDRGDAEANLRSYVEEGGTLILDATGNLDGLSYTLSDTIFLETLIRRADVDADGQLVADPDLAAERPELQSIDSAPFRDEGGGSWHGAAYESVTGESAHSALVRLDGRPVVSIQRLGSGRIYWIGSNLIWHAFLYGEPEEALLVQAVIEHALEHSGDPDAGASSD